MRRFILHASQAYKSRDGLVSRGVVGRIQPPSDPPRRRRPGAALRDGRQPDWLLTHNTKHFTAALAKRTGLRIAAPVEFFRTLSSLLR